MYLLKDTFECVHNITPVSPLLEVLYCSDSIWNHVIICAIFPLSLAFLSK